jgi:hypothetical protein
MPAKESCRRHEQRPLPRPPRENTTERCQQRPISRRQLRTGDLALKHPAAAATSTQTRGPHPENNPPPPLTLPISRPRLGSAESEFSAPTRSPPGDQPRLGGAAGRSELADAGRRAVRADGRRRSRASDRRRAAADLLPDVLETRVYTTLGVPAVACGPGLIDQMHGPAEYVPVANLDAAAATYVDSARALHRRDIDGPAR